MSSAACGPATENSSDTGATTIGQDALVRVRCVDGDGQPLPAIQVTVQYAAYSKPNPRWTKSDGLVVMRANRTRTACVVATDRDLGWAFAELSREPDQAHTLQLAGRARMEGTVRTSAGVALTGVDVSLRPPPDVPPWLVNRLHWNSRGRSDADGRFRVARLQPGVRYGLFVNKKKIRDVVASDRPDLVFDPRHTIELVRTLNTDTTLNWSLRGTSSEVVDGLVSFQLDGYWPPDRPSVLVPARDGQVNLRVQRWDRLLFHQEALVFPKRGGHVRVEIVDQPYEHGVTLRNSHRHPVAVHRYRRGGLRGTSRVIESGASLWLPVAGGKTRWCSAVYPQGVAFWTTDDAAHSSEIAIPKGPASSSMRIKVVDVRGFPLRRSTVTWRAEGPWTWHVSYIGTTPRLSSGRTTLAGESVLVVSSGPAKFWQASAPGYQTVMRSWPQAGAYTIALDYAEDSNAKTK